MELQVPQIDARIFTHVKEEKKLVAEHSTAGNVSFTRRLYDDACDVGIQVFNPKTGSVTRWYLAGEDKDREGELQATNFRPCSESVRRNPEVEGYTIILFND